MVIAIDLLAIGSWMTRDSIICFLVLLVSGFIGAGCSHGPKEGLCQVPFVYSQSAPKGAATGWGEHSFQFNKWYTFKNSVSINFVGDQGKSLDGKYQTLSVLMRTGAFAARIHPTNIKIPIGNAGPGVSDPEATRLGTLTFHNYRTGTVNAHPNCQGKSFRVIVSSGFAYVDKAGKVVQKTFDGTEAYQHCVGVKKKPYPDVKLDVDCVSRYGLDVALLYKTGREVLKETRYFRFYIQPILAKRYSGYLNGLLKESDKLFDGIAKAVGTRPINYLRGVRKTPIRLVYEPKGKVLESFVSVAGGVFFMVGKLGDIGGSLLMDVIRDKAPLAHEILHAVNHHYPNALKNLPLSFAENETIAEYHSKRVAAPVLSYSKYRNKFAKPGQLIKTPLSSFGFHFSKIKTTAPASTLFTSPKNRIRTLRTGELVVLQANLKTGRGVMVYVDRITKSGVNYTVLTGETSLVRHPIYFSNQYITANAYWVGGKLVLSPLDKTGTYLNASIYPPRDARLYPTLLGRYMNGHQNPDQVMKNFLKVILPMRGKVDSVIPPQDLLFDAKALGKLQIDHFVPQAHQRKMAYPFLGSLHFALLIRDLSSEFASFFPELSGKGANRTSLLKMPSPRVQTPEQKQNGPSYHRHDIASQRHVLLRENTRYRDLF